MYEITAQEGQTLADIALARYGHTDGLVLLVLDNPYLGSVDADLQGGEQLQIRDIGEPGFDDALRNIIELQNIQVNSGEKYTPGVGIGAMKIGIDNIIV